MLSFVLPNTLRIHWKTPESRDALHSAGSAPDLALPEVANQPGVKEPENAFDLPENFPGCRASFEVSHTRISRGKRGAKKEAKPPFVRTPRVHSDLFPRGLAEGGISASAKRLLVLCPARRVLKSQPILRRLCSGVQIGDGLPLEASAPDRVRVRNPPQDKVDKHTPRFHRDPPLVSQ
jgi:hypothetical protein